MQETGGDLDLAQKSLGTDGIGELWPQNLQRDRTVVPEVVREEDQAHPAAPELTLDRVAPGQGVLKAADGISHGGAFEGLGSIIPRRPSPSQRR